MFTRLVAAGALCVSLIAGTAQASVLVNFSFTLNPGPGGAAEDYSGSFRLDGDWLHDLPAGTPSGGANRSLAHRYIGYGIGAISDLTPIIVGGVTFGSAHVQQRIPAPGHAAAVWFDEVPVIGASPKIWLSLRAGLDNLGLGSSICPSSTSCELAPRIFAELDASTYSGTFTSVSVTSVAPVPLPATLPLMAAALAGLGLLTRRRRTRAAGFA